MTTRRLTSLIPAVLLFFLAPVVSRAAVKNWVGGTGNWSVGSNWNGGTVPASGDTVNITPTDGVPRTVTYNIASPTLQSLTVDLTGAGANRTTLELPGNPLTLTDGFIVGSSGRATINHSAGTVMTTNVSLDSVVGFNAGGNGIYNLSGTGTLQLARNLYVGTLASSTGTFNQSGNTSVVATRLILGSAAGATGSYTVSGGIVSTSSALLVGNLGAGTLNIQPGGSAWTTNLSINSSSNVNLNGGTLRFSTVSGLHRLNHNSGTIQLAGGRNFQTDSVIPVLFPGLTIPVGKTLTIEGAITIPNQVTLNGGVLYGPMTSPFRIGFGSGSANLFILNGGSVVAANSSETQVGSVFSEVDSGQVQVSGANSFFSTGALVVGGNSAGTLRVEEGGQVQSSSGFLGGVSINSGAATVKDPGSTWTIANNLTVGGAGGLGVLNLTDQALVFVGNQLVIHNSNGVVTLNGGVLRFNSITNINRLSFTSGIIQLTGNRDVGADPTIASLFGGLFSLPVIPTGKGLTVEGIATLSKPLTVAGGMFKTNGLVIGSGGALDFDRGVFELSGGSIVGLPSLNIPTNGEFRSAGTHTMRITGAAGSTLTATGNLTVGNATLPNGFYSNGTVNVGPHTVTLQDANDAVLDSGALVTVGGGGTPGTLAAANGLTLDFGGNITGQGTINTPNNAAKPFINNGHVVGNSPAQRLTLPGYVKGVGTLDQVTITGTFAPGFSSATVYAGSVAYAGTLEIEIGGTSPGSFDRIIHAGTATLGGTLMVALINGFVPSVGQSFDFLSAANFAGAFESIVLPALPGLAWDLSQLASGTLSVVAGLPGDFNFDGRVDGADFLLWQRGQSPAAMSAGDLTAWRNHFGTSSTAAVTAAVPEPATGLAALVFVVVASSATRRGNASRWSPPTPRPAQ
ncbi:MAG TPA: hypothetical protein PKC18_01490 [Lacipirellulaceae bacterium]|nr:hypothetical protein [Lacipirellulaceae bacterium]HMP04926.1 hypothetical protein [Lacipirellulaceae bacterium]